MQPDSTLAEAISATKPDWSREALDNWWDPGKQLLRSLRRYQKWRSRGGLMGKIVSRWTVLTHRFWSVASGADIPLGCNIGGGLLLTHPSGVVVHPEARIGCNCLLLQQVTLVAGVKLGGHVDIGAGAKIVRPITVGDHAIIGANAVVLKDIPAGATAIGIPAKVLESKTSQSDA
jgi:serine O-acetyltransferase